MNIHEKYQELLNQELDQCDRIDVRNKYAWELSRVDTAKSLEMAMDIKSKSIAENHNKGLAESYRTLGQCYWLIGDYTSAIDHLEPALDIFTDLKLLKGEAEILNLFGGIHSKMGDLDKAYSYFNDALELRKSIDDIEGIAKSMNSLGDVYMRRKNFDDALATFQEILKLDYQNEMYRGIVLYNISEVYYHLEDFESSEKYIGQCKAIGEKLNFALMRIYCSSLLGKIEKGKKNYLKAIDHLGQALIEAKNINSEERTYAILEDLAEAYELNGNDKLALKLFKEFHATKENVMSKESSERLKTMEHRMEVDRLKSETEKERLRNLELQRAAVIIEESRNRIEEQNKEIIDSIKYAERIQSAILPSDKYFKTLLPDSFVFFQPKDVLSGDFYWISGAITDKSERFILAAVVDCTGHGVPGALMSIIGNNFLRLCEKESTVNRPSEALEFINSGISKTLRQELSESAIKDGMDMAFVAIDYPNMKLHFAGAKSPLYHIRNGELTEYKGDKHPIGAYLGEELIPFSNHTIDMQTGDVIYLFSDGFADQFGGERGKKFMYKPFRELLKSICSLPMSEQNEIIKTTFHHWKGDFEQLDDVCLIGIRI
ncbi:MAG: tetratricopeptide repeat protein [Flavobacteriales bacterium]|nr:tetratricopeptide repeat protein [Flavobacteriales bacterium]